MTSRAFSLPIFLHCLSIIISAVVTGLATVNFGVLSIWINSTAGFLTVAYHIIILIFKWRENRGTPGARHGLRPLFARLDVKMPTTPSPTYIPPPFDSEKLSPNRRPISTRVVIPDPANIPAAGNSNHIQFKAFYSLASLFVLIVLQIVTILGFGMTVQVSINGAGSLLPAERAKGMTFPWNMKIQKAQCTFMGIQILLGLVVLALCVRGRSEISSHENARREEIEYGLASSPSEVIFCSSARFSVFFSDGILE
jgi:hypothetical protein